MQSRDSSITKGHLIVEILQVKQLQLNKYHGIDPVQDKRDQLRSQFVLLTAEGKQVPTGQSFFDISSLLDQEKIQIWREIEGMGELAEMKVSLNWIRRTDDFYRYRLHSLEIQKQQVSQHIAQLEQCLRDLMDPFVFLNSNQRFNFLPYSKFAQGVLKGIDFVADQVKIRFGLEDIPWYKATYYGCLIYGIITALVMFYRPDFLNITVSAAAIYTMTSTFVDNGFFIFRIVTGLIFALVLDFFWLCIFGFQLWGDIIVDGGGLEKTMRRFSIVMSIVSLLYKIVLTGMVWKFSTMVSKTVKKQQRESESDFGGTRSSNQTFASQKNPFQGR